MKCFSGFLILSLAAISGFSQPQSRVIIVNAENRKPVEAATVSIKNGVTVATNDEGYFTPAKSTSALDFHITATGYEPKDTSFIPGSQPVTIYLTPKNLLLQPVEVNALRAGENAPFAKTNLSKSYIQKNNLGQDLPYILNQIPNIVINSDAGNGIGYTGMRIRGTDGTRINMTINGIPYNDAESQGSFLVNIPDIASSLTSIQVQRGVGTSSNGAGAFGASLNVSTNEYNEKAYVELNNSYGSFNSWKNTVKLGTGLLANHFTFDARLSNLTSDGYVDRAESNFKSAYLSAGYWGKKTAIRFNAILGKEKTYQSWNGVNDKQLLTDRTYNSVGTEKTGEPYDNETDNYWQNNYQLFWNQEINTQWNFNTAFFYTPGHGYYEQYKADQKLSKYNILPLTAGGTTFTNSDIVRRLWLDNHYFGQIFSFQQKTATHQFTLGGGWNKYLGDHFGEVIWAQVQPSIYSKYYMVDATKTDVNLYAKWQQNIGKNWELFGDIQYRNVNYKINGFRDNPDIRIDAKYDFVNPKAGVSFHRDNWSGFFSYAMANKEPNRNDFEAGLTLQPKREQLNDFELNIKKRNIIPGLELGATFYYMLYKDQLVLTGKINDVGAYTRTNIPDSYRAGAELEANYRQRLWNVAYSVSFSKNKIKNFTEFVDDYDNGGQKIIAHGTTDIAFSPSVVQNLAVNLLPVKNLELSWMGKHVGRQNLDNTGSKDRSLKGFVVNDIRAAYTLHVKFVKEARIAFQLNNLFNVKYEPNGYTFSYISSGRYTYENYYFPQAGTNFMLALNLRF